MSNKKIAAKAESKKIDWIITILPLVSIVGLCVLFFFMPDQSSAVLNQVNYFFGNTFGTYYLVIGLGIFLLSFLWLVLVIRFNPWIKFPFANSPSSTSTMFKELS